MFGTGRLAKLRPLLATRDAENAREGRLGVRSIDFARWEGMESETRGLTSGGGISTFRRDDAARFLIRPVRRPSGRRGRACLRLAGLAVALVPSGCGGPRVAMVTVS